MMDLSDGLSLDLGRLCTASGVGARLYANRLPCPPVADATDALELALHGGEDYQLLFTVAPRKCLRVPSYFSKLPLTCVGEVRAEEGISLVTVEGKALALKPAGYDHFARTRHL
jgi:thiamine-monophosphate kinase